MTSQNDIHTLMAQIMRLYFSRNFTLFEKIDLHPGQVPILNTMARIDGLSQKEIADRLCVTAPTVAVSLKRLERAGYVVRRPDKNDQRISRNYITQKGRDCVRQIDDIIAQVDQETFAGFTPEEKMLMRRLFLIMKENLSKVSDEMECDRFMKKHPIMEKEGKAEEC